MIKRTDRLEVMDREQTTSPVPFNGNTPKTNREGLGKKESKDVYSTINHAPINGLTWKPSRIPPNRPHITDAYAKKQTKTARTETTRQPGSGAHLWYS